jgi:hypothetical protein
MKNKKIPSSILTVLLLVLATACSKRDDAIYMSSSDLLNDNRNSMNPPAAPASPNLIAVVTFDQILSSMASVAGVTPSAATLAFAEVNRSSFSLNGKASEITSGMWMSVTALAGHVCRDLFALESGRSNDQRVYYRDVAFAGGNFQSVRVEVIQRLSLGAWSRMPSSAEIGHYETALTEASLGAATLNAAQTQSALLILCTGALGSLAAHVR